MRKTMEAVGLGILAVLFWITYAALNSPEKLPPRIPTHFDFSGQPNAWGPPGFLWFLPAVGAGMYLLMTILGSIRFRRYNLPVPVTESNLPFIQEQTAVMVTWIKCELLCLFSYLQWSMIQSARSSAFRVSPMMIPVFLLAIFSTVGWHLAAIIRGARTRIELADPARHMKNY